MVIPGQLRESPIGVELRHWLRARPYRELRRSLYGGAFEQHRCIFIHIPKTGGLSVAQSLFNSQQGGHRTALDYRVILGPSRFAAYFKFAFVRHPVDRLVSAFTFLKQGGLHGQDAAWAAENLADYETVDDFASHWLSHEHASSWRHFRPQCDFVCDRTGQLLVDFVGRYERLDSDFAVLSDRLNVSTELQYVNRGPGTGGLPRQLSASAREAIAQVYAADFETFGYSLGAK